MAQRQTINPRTVLGFYATIILILLTASISSASVLAITGVATELIPWLFGAAGLLVAAIIAGVFYINVKRPANLMLGQITGMEYAEIHKRVLLGDDIHGEREVLMRTDVAGFAHGMQIVDAEALPIEAGSAQAQQIVASDDAGVAEK